MLNNGLINKDSLGVLELYDKLFSNNDKFEQKIRITQLKVQPGKEKLDKDGNIILDSFGVPCKWDDRFYMTYVCVNGGGSHICSISQDLFVTLQEQVVYIAKGYVEYKIYGDNYNSTPVVVFNKFINERDNLVAGLAVLENNSNQS
ncbi:MAG: hypothetical protein PUB96_00680 [Helicobacteraceae bacterium]|nr:hypothetical protein [Helicobacteraceae bacterium]